MLASIALLAAAMAAMPAAYPPAGAGALLPTQDRISDPELARLVQETLAERLAAAGIRSDPVALRDSMRRTRLRSARAAAGPELARLGRELQVDWFFTATLHDAVSQPVPQITLSAQVLSADGREMIWAGFRSATGLDGLRSLGRGVIPGLQDLVRQEAAALADEFLTRRLASSRKPGRPTRRDTGGYAAGRWTAQELGLVAVVPFDSNTDQDATRNAEIFTCMAWAVLHDHGVRLVSPGNVLETLRSRQMVSLERLDMEARAALQIATGAERLFTGMVEIYDRSPTLDPNPHVSLSAKLLVPTSGEVLWIHGAEAHGADGEAPFKRDRVRAAGKLAREMLDRMVAGFLTPQTEMPTAEEPAS